MPALADEIWNDVPLLTISVGNRKTNLFQPATLTSSGCVSYSIETYMVFSYLHSSLDSLIRELILCSSQIQDLPVHQRGDAVSSMVYEADARVRDPVYGCVSAISALQHQIALLQNQLAVANAEIVCMRMHQAASNAVTLKSSSQATPPEMSPPLQPRSPELQHYKPATKALEKGEALWT